MRGKTGSSATTTTSASPTSTTTAPSRSAPTTDSPTGSSSWPAPNFHGCYSVGDDTLWGVNRRKKGAANTLAALQSIRAARPDGAPIYVILDNLSAHKGTDIRRWATKHKVELCSPRPTPLGPTPSRPTSDR
ncbi:hypothetical protein GCM10010299_22110 [Streptomyces tanashiensis]|nr:hypothetical protein GCM10010299_22110 [Streptomyces tanashiensis]